MSAPDGVEELDRDRLVWMFTQMLRIREFEERVKRTFVEHPGVIRGHTHLADGAEASIVGSIADARAPATSSSRPTAATATRSRCGTRHEGDDGRDLRPQRTASARASAARCTSSTSSAASSAPRASSPQGIPHATGAAWAAQIRKQGQVVLCFFGDGASKQGAFHESLNIASLWKLPIVFVMENNGYNVHTRTEQEDANARRRRGPLASRRRRTACPGVTIDGGDPVAVHETVGAAVARARGGRGPDARRVARLPPLRPRQHHRPARRAAALPRARGDREVRRARGVRGRAARRPGARASAAGSSPTARSAAEDADAHRRRGPRRDAGRGRLRPRQPVPGRRDAPSTTSTPEEAIDMAHELPYIAAIDEAIHARDGARRHASCTSARTWRRPRTSRSSTRSARTACASRRSPRRPRSAWRSAPRWPATARSSSSTWPSSCSSRWTRSSTRRRASAT